MFTPPRCPNSDCSAHLQPDADDRPFFFRNGFYHPKCRAVPVPRFVCRACHLGFSRQTFRVDYRDKKPHLNAASFRLLASGVGLRQSARILGLSRRCNEEKVRKLSRHLGRLNRNLTDQFDNDSQFTLDEMETFEGERAVLPVTLPILIETRSMFVIATDVATIRPSGPMPQDRRKAIARAEEKHGRREDRSKAALSRTFRRLRFFTEDVDTLIFTSDKKRMYSQLLRKFFGEKAVHVQISSKRKRDQLNPLKHINLTNAMARELCSRLRRRSWLVSKARRFLRTHLHVFVAYRNFIRRRINRRPETPAQLLGFLPRAATFEDLLSWRQDWKLRSIHPLARQAESIADVRCRTAA